MTPLDGAPRIARVTWQGVRVPFARPFATAHGTLAHREGLLVTLEAEGGLAGVGEASPWPPFGLGDAADAARLLAARAPHMIGRSSANAIDAFDGLDLAAPGVAAARCAVDIAAHDLAGKACGVPVAVLLGGAAPADDARWSGRVLVNATIGALAPAAAAAASRRAVAAGFTCLKVKVAAGPLAEDEARVAAVREAAGPGARIRLDANGAWDEAEAIAAIARLARHDLELVEQPVAAGDLAGLARVRRAVRVPIAADEAVRDVAGARRIIALGAADALVVKPMTAGGLAAGRAILELAAAAGLAAFVTTTIDFGPGIAGALALSWATVRRDAPFARHCGLATADLLASALVGDPPAVADGQMAVPRTPGLGVTLDPDLVRRYAVEPIGQV